MIRVRFEDVVIDKDHFNIGGRVVRTEHITFAIVQERWMPASVLLTLAALYLIAFSIAGGGSLFGLPIVAALLFGTYREALRRFTLVIDGIDLRKLVVVGLDRSDVERVTSALPEIFGEEVHTAFTV